MKVLIGVFNKEKDSGHCLTSRRFVGSSTGHTGSDQRMMNDPPPSLILTTTKQSVVSSTYRSSDCLHNQLIGGMPRSYQLSRSCSREPSVNVDNTEYDGEMRMRGWNWNQKS